MSKPIHQTVLFSIPPHDVYQALMDSDQHSRFTGSPAVISPQVGGAISAYDDYISGSNLELVPDQRIVQSWRAVDWEPGFFSQVEFNLSPTPQGTRLDFTHTHLPEGSEDEFANGWQGNYWEPLQRWFASTRDE